MSVSGIDSVRTAVTAGAITEPQQRHLSLTADQATVTEVPVITFIIPVRHPANARNWPELMRNLAQTIQSMGSQTDRSWRAIVVANVGAELPDMPDGFQVERVDFPPNPTYEYDERNLAQVYEGVRLDKGRRVHAGMLAAAGSRYLMVVDDDDFISRDLVAFVRRNSGANGWFIKRGYVWQDGGKLMIMHQNFHSYCGTSLIVRSDLYNLSATADEDSIKRTFGSHVYVKADLERAGTPLAPLPFIGAIYRVGHPGAHSKSKGILRTFLFHRAHLRRPQEFIKNLRHLRLLTPGLGRRFGISA